MPTTLRLLCSLVLKGAFDASLAREFEASSGRTLETEWAPTVIVLQRLASGARPDVLVVVDDAMAELAMRGVVDPATVRIVAQSRIGVAVAQGAQRPDLSDLESFKRAMLAARSVCYSRAGASGLHVAPMLERIGIAAAVNARATIIPAGFTAERLLTGEADLAIQQLAELQAVPGVDIVGPLPDAVQKVSRFAAAIAADAADRDGAAQLLDAMASPGAAEAYRASGLDPA